MFSTFEKGLLTTIIALVLLFVGDYVWSVTQTPVRPPGIEVPVIVGALILMVIGGLIYGIWSE